MRAAANNIHISGAECLVKGDHVEAVMTEFLWRALRSCTNPDEVCITVDSVKPDSVTYLKSLDVRTITASSCNEAHRTSQRILESNGISSVAIREAFILLQDGPTPEGTNMRGSIIMDAFTGERLEPDIRRGVRVSRIDYTDDARGLLERVLKEYGIYHERVLDALAIATKVTSRVETIAEVCWSDNPDYTTGYVASRQNGYVRITNMKEKGSWRGGRVFFVNPEGLDPVPYIDYLEKQPVMIDRIGEIT